MIAENELAVYKQQAYGLDQLGYQANCSSGLLGQAGFNYPQIQYCYCSPPSLGNFEIQIQQVSNDTDPILNYGAKLRLLIADPIKGHDLREALHKLKTALKEAYA